MCAWCLVLLLPAPHFEPYNQTAGFSPIEDAPLKPSISFKNMVVISCEKCVLDIDWIEVYFVASINVKILVLRFFAAFDVFKLYLLEFLLPFNVI